MENKKFNGFMVFMALAMTLLFLSLRVTFFVSLVSSLILTVLLRACWIAYNLLYSLIGGVDFEAFRRKEGKQKREV